MKFTKILPSKLNIGDTIGVVAPSNPIIGDNIEELNRAKEIVEKSGFKVKYSKNLFSNTNGYCSTAKEKAEDINEMFADKNVKMIWCAKGGNNSNSTFEYLDYELIKKNPKIICGYSDITSLTNIITEKTGLVTFSGTNFKTIATDETDFSYKQALNRFLNRSLEFEENGQKMYLNNLIQTDATINSGSSGGALIDINGNLIGINTIKISSVESMNFAVPIDIVIPILKILEKENKIEEVQLGIWGYDKYSIAEIDSNANLKEGIYVTNVEQNSISELAGIKSGDIILSIEEEKVGTLMDFKVKIYEKMYKKSIILKIKSSGRNQ